MNSALQLDSCDKEIVTLLQEGCSNGEISAGAGISVGAVKKRLRDIYFRAGLSHGRKRVRLMGILPGAAAAEKRELPANLSVVERSIAKLAIQGLTNPDIAVLCGSGEQLIKNHLRAIFDKCGVWTRTELAARFKDV